MEPAPLTAAERVAQLIQCLDITPYQFARETGLSHQTISNVLTGKNRPSLDTLEAIAGRYADTAIWLLTGRGEPRTGAFAPEMVARGAAPAPAPTAPTPGLTSGPATVAEAENVLLKEQVKEQREMIQWLKVELGKSPGSSVAAGPPVYPMFPHVPVAGFRLAAQYRGGVVQVSR